jgi:ADP-dependent phosphofructokinase/glucokinase
MAGDLRTDSDSYIAAKTDFILGILKQIGLNETELADIRRINQMENLARPDPTLNLPTGSS